MFHPYFTQKSSAEEILKACEKAKNSSEFGNLPDWAQKALGGGKIKGRKAALISLHVLELEAARRMAIEEPNQVYYARYLPQWAQEALVVELGSDSKFVQRKECAAALRELHGLIRDVESYDAKPKPSAPRKNTKKAAKHRLARAKRKTAA